MGGSLKGVICIALILLPIQGVVGIPPLGKTPILNDRKVEREKFDFHVELHEGYDLFWTFTEEDITFQVEVETTGWVGFGISPNGDMKSADLVIGWMDGEGNPVFHDRHGVGMTYPPIDEHQDWDLLDAVQTDAHLTLQFTRPLDLCNEEDLPIQDGTMRVIWAANDEAPPDGETPKYHGTDNRGTRSLHLLFHTNPDPGLPDDVITMDLTMKNISIPAKDTYYYCNFFHVPELTEKHHVIRYEPIYTPGNEVVLHHLLVYRCRTDLDVDEIGGECYTPNMPPEMGHCDVFQFAWAIGEEGVNYPSHTGFPFDPVEGPTLLMMEIHYDNPDLLEGHYDSSGLRLYLTPTLRESDSGVFSVGTLFYPLWPIGNLAIPPHANSFCLYNHCPADCLQKSMEEDGLDQVQVYGVSLHAHLAGAKFIIRHFRNDEELEPWIIDNNYDFNFQRYIFFKEEITVLPTDKIEAICEWDSTHREQVTWGGPATTQEMCQGYILYYPQFYMTQCWSEPTAEYQLRLVNATTEPAGGYPGYQVTAPEEYVGMTQQQIFATLDWTDPCLREDLEKLYNEGTVESWLVCTTREDGWRRTRRDFEVMSNVHEKDPVCGWQDGSKEEKCYDDDAVVSTSIPEEGTTGGGADEEGTTEEGDPDHGVANVPTRLLNLFICGIILFLVN